MATRREARVQRRIEDVRRLPPFHTNDVIYQEQVPDFLLSSRKISDFINYIVFLISKIRI